MIVVVFVHKYFADTNIFPSLSKDFSLVQLYLYILPSNISFFQRISSLLCNCICIFCRPIFLASFREFLLFRAIVIVYSAHQYFSQSFRGFLLFCAIVFDILPTNISRSLSEDFFSFVHGTSRAVKLVRAE